MVVSLKIFDTKVINNTTFYYISVESDGVEWVVKRRFSDFEKLHAGLQRRSVLGDKALRVGTLPPKGTFGFRHRLGLGGFNEERLNGLRTFLAQLAKQVESIGESKGLENFLSQNVTSNEEAESVVGSEVGSAVGSVLGDPQSELSGIQEGGQSDEESKKLHKIEQHEEFVSSQDDSRLEEIGKTHDDGHHDELGDIREDQGVLSYPPVHQSHSTEVESMVPVTSEQKLDQLEDFIASQDESHSDEIGKKHTDGHHDEPSEIREGHHDEPSEIREDQGVLSSPPVPPSRPTEVRQFSRATGTSKPSQWCCFAFLSR
eukprot:TRINITY_DN6572_c0_g1_i1.p1 TRINITY_DN6572_c0_g1~~TRINITY_DN6572_c0_g1_i1.p1  ORF type:complete len:355 (+),score=52.65 TRINITY_DN6572_c0_g1_i1:120-1067(+)